MMEAGYFCPLVHIVRRWEGSKIICSGETAECVGELFISYHGSSVLLTPLHTAAPKDVTSYTETTRMVPQRGFIKGNS